MIAVALHAHAREAYLPRILDQLTELRRRLPVRVVACLDRPTEAVERLVTDGLSSGDLVVKPPLPLVDRTENFPRVQGWLLDSFIAPMRPRWVGWQPDDWIYEPGWEDELPRALDGDDADVLLVRALYFWDAERIRLDIFPTCDPLFWRWRPGATYDDQRQILMPPALLDEARSAGRARILRMRVLDFGFATPADRDRCWQRAKRCGKIDAYTTALVTTPRRLVTYDEIRDRHDIPEGRP